MSQVSVSEASRNLSHWINRAAYGQESVFLMSHGRPKAVLIGVELFEELTRTHPEQSSEPMSTAELRAGLRNGLREAGYETPDDIVRLIQEIRGDILAEQNENHESR